MSEEILSADMSNPSRPAVTPQAVVGVSICLMGIALTLDNFGIYELRSFAELWPIVPISIGVLTLMYGETRQDWVKGTLWLALGIFFIFRHPLIRDVWPLVLIGLGGYLVWRSRTGPPAARKWQTEVRLETDDPYATPPMPPGAATYGDVNAVGSMAGAPPGEPSVPGGAGPGIPHPGMPGPGIPGQSGAPYIPPIPEAYRQATSGGAGSAGPGTSLGAGAAGIAAGSRRVRERIRERKRNRWGCTPDWRSAPPPPPGREPFGPENAGQGTEHAFGAFRSHPNTGRGQRPTLFAMMSGVRRQVTGGFAGAEATAIMGGVELDLRYSAMDGDEVIIDTFALWGGIEIWVPAHWEIVSQGLPLMGAFEDKTHVTTHGGNRQPRLVVRGVAIMGGVEIKN
jgi:hypothetical protein